MMETVTIKKLSIEDIYDNFIKRYESGHFTEGVCEWNGDDALMSPRSFAHAFKKECEEHGHRYDQYKSMADEIEEWCQLHIGHLESKFV